MRDLRRNRWLLLISLLVVGLTMLIGGIDYVFEHQRIDNSIFAALGLSLVGAGSGLFSRNPFVPLVLAIVFPATGLLMLTVFVMLLPKSVM